MQDKKKAKEVAACEVNLSMFTVKKDVPYGAKVRVEWTHKVPKGFEAQMEKAPAVLLIYIHIGGTPSNVPAPSPRVKAPPETRKAEKKRYGEIGLFFFFSS